MEVEPKLGCCSSRWIIVTLELEQWKLAWFELTVVSKTLDVVVGDCLLKWFHWHPNIIRRFQGECPLEFWSALHDCIEQLCLCSYTLVGSSCHLDSQRRCHLERQNISIMFQFKEYYDILNVTQNFPIPMHCLIWQFRVHVMFTKPFLTYLCSGIHVWQDCE